MNQPIHSNRTKGRPAMPSSSTGFTLVELLVVIAIIGILSAVVLAALGTARQKGADASAKSSLVGPREQGELYFYANGNSYANVCQPNPVNGIKTIYAQVLAAANAEGLSTINNVNTTAGGPNTVTCHDSTTAWAAEVPLKLGGFFCVDSTGSSTTTPASGLTVSDASCN